MSDGCLDVVALTAREEELGNAAERAARAMEEVCHCKLLDIYASNTVLCV